jgi:simple sugar transport system permease protein
VAVALGLILSGVMVLFLKKNPFSVFAILFSSMFRDGYTIGEIFVKATPLIFTALAFAFTFKASLFNIGAQGQFYIGAITAVSISLAIPSPIAIPLSIIGSFITSGIWGGFIGFSKAKFKANEFLISMMSTYVALNFMNYLLRTVLMESKGEYPSLRLHLSSHCSSGCMAYSL